MNSNYPRTRQLLAPSLREASDRTIEQALASQGLQAGAVEDIWGDIGNAVSSVASAALPTLGGLAGSLIPIPGLGTAIGTGLGGLAASALHSAIGSGQQQPTPAQQPAPPPPAAAGFGGALGQYRPSSPAYPYPSPAPAASSQQLAALLLQALSRPELVQALVQMLLGPAGSPTVQVPTSTTTAATSIVPGLGQVAASAPQAGGFPVLGQIPVSALTNMLGTLGTAVSEAYNNERATAESIAPFTYGNSPWGSPTDLASNEARARALLETLQASGDGGLGAMRAREMRKKKLANVAQALEMVAFRQAHPALT